MKLSTLIVRAILPCAVMLRAVSADAQVVYRNDFETNTAGFNTTARVSLPSADGPTQWLGRLTGSNTTLTLTGLTRGARYEVAFDLYIGGTWDGSGVFGPDFFRLSNPSGGSLVNATFCNGFPLGDPRPLQSYSDATPLGGTMLHPARSGADVPSPEPIYSFGHGPRNPRPTFIAAGPSVSLIFSSVDAQGITDEFFALDNVVVSRVEAPVDGGAPVDASTPDVGVTDARVDDARVDADEVAGDAPVDSGAAEPDAPSDPGGRDADARAIADAVVADARDEVPASGERGSDGDGNPNGGGGGCSCRSLPSTGRDGAESLLLSVCAAAYLARRRALGGR